MRSQTIAIIGSGIAGMTAARKLAPHHEVHLFESGAELGGHTATKDVEVASGRYAIDTGFIVFNDWTYPNFIRLMTEAGVVSKDSEMSFAVRNDRLDLEYNGADLARLFAQRRNLVRPGFYRMLLEILRFNREAPAILERASVDSITLGEFLDRGKFSKLFAENYAMAMGGAIWSASFAQMRDFPLRFFVQFFKNHGMLSVDERPVWKVIEGGSRSYIRPLSKPLFESAGADPSRRIHLSTPIEGVRRNAAGVTLKIGGSRRREENFDQVVFACHSDTARRILDDPSPAENEILGALEYQPNDVVLHTDPSVLPRRRRAWAAWNHLIRRDEKGEGGVALTYHMNILQRIEAPENFLVSLNITDLIDPKTILGRWTYDHPRITLASVRAQSRWSEISGIEKRTHYCGAYWANGFHEDGVVSGLRVAAGFGLGIDA